MGRRDYSSQHEDHLLYLMMRHVWTKYCNQLYFINMPIYFHCAVMNISILRSFHTYQACKDNRLPMWALFFKDTMENICRTLHHRPLTFFYNFTFSADLEFIFQAKKSAEIFQCPLFCCWKEISKNVADNHYFLNIPCFVTVWKCHHW